jgi:hypothetical protein
MAKNMRIALTAILLLEGLLLHLLLSRVHLWLAWGVTVPNALILAVGRASHSSNLNARATT